MAKPVDLFSIPNPERFPQGEALLAALRAAHDLFNAAWPTLDELERELANTEMGMRDDGTPIPDEELAFQHLALGQLEALLTALVKKRSAVEDASERRMWTAITNRLSQGFVAFGKTFTAEGDLLPTPPKEGTPEYDELLAWFYADEELKACVKVSVPWPSIKATCELLAARGLPRPPHVKVSPKSTIRVSR